MSHRTFAKLVKEEAAKKEAKTVPKPKPKVPAGKEE